MALREVTVEVTAKYIIKVNADNPNDARQKAEDLVWLGITPDDMDTVILDVLPIKEST